MAITISGSGITSSEILDGTILNADINASAAIAGSKVDGSFGKVLQVVSVPSSSSTACSTSTYIDVTGATATITPTSTSSKILVLFDVTGYVNYITYDCKHKLLRGSTSISIGHTHINHNGNWSQQGININYLDSPSTTSATTYKVMINRANTGTWNINPSSTSGMNMTLIEIGS